MLTIQHETQRGSIFRKKTVESNKSTKEDTSKSLVEQQVSKGNNFLNGSCYKWNKIGHKVLECKNSVSQNSISSPVDVMHVINMATKLTTIGTRL